MFFSESRHPALPFEASTEHSKLHALLRVHEKQQREGSFHEVGSHVLGELIVVEKKLDGLDLFGGVFLDGFGQKGREFGLSEDGRGEDA